MTGVITLRHVLAHPVLVIRGFGCRVFVRCIWAACRHEQRTFLSILCSSQERPPLAVAGGRGRAA
jgi:hypothetical protein